MADSKYFELTDTAQAPVRDYQSGDRALVVSGTGVAMVDMDSAQVAMDAKVEQLRGWIAGRQTYETLAEAQAAGEPADGGSVDVMNDTDPVNNGTWYWSAANSRLEKSPLSLSAVLLDAEEAQSQGHTNPNVFSRSQLSGAELPAPLSDSVVSAVSIDGVPAIKVQVGASGIGSCYWRFPVSVLDDATTFSASIICQSADAGSSGEVVITQRDSGLETLEVNFLISDQLGAITSPAKFKLINQLLNASTEWIDLRINFNDSIDQNRESHWRAMMLAPGKASSFRGPDIAGNALDIATSAAAVADAAAPLDVVLDSSDPNCIIDVELADDYGSLTRSVEHDGSPVLVATDGLTDVQEGLAVNRAAIAGASVSFGCSVFYTEAANFRILLQQLDVDSQEIRDTGDGNGDYRHEFSVPEVADGSRHDLTATKLIAPECETLRLLLMPNGRGGRVGRLFIREYANRYSSVSTFVRSSRVFHISPAGDDSRPGKSATPKASLKAAILSGAREIIVEDGEYLPWQMELDGRWIQHGGVDVIAASQARPFTRSGLDLSGFSMTTGRADVYEVACATAPAGWSDVGDHRGFVFAKSIPMTAITRDNRHPLHGGRSHVAPHFIFKPAADLDDLETSDDPTWWWDGSTTLYVRSVPDVDPTTMTVVVPTTSLVYAMNDKKITMAGIGYEFSGLVLDNSNGYTLENMWIFGAPSDGLSLDKCSGQDRHCRVVASSNDNWNIHNQTATPGRQDGYSTVSAVNHSVEPYSAWAFDDGRSIHEASKGSVHGGLFEYCGSTGLAPASGAEEIVRGSLIRGCGWELGPQEQQGGIAVVNSVIDDGNDTVCNAYDVRVEGQKHAFYVSSDAGLLNLYNTRSTGCEYALVAAHSDAVINAHGHVDDGSAVLSSGVGTVNVLSV